MKNSTKLNTQNGVINRQIQKVGLNQTATSHRSSDVLVSAVISPLLLTHLHQTLQKSEFHAKKEGRLSHAANLAKLRKVLCLDARSMEDASAKETKDPTNDLYINNNSAKHVA
tara:strand:- start:1509 stop:1847 length:339 start_codon:yes stop_codon:yes gene_type:complete